MELVWQSIYLVVAVGGSLVVAILASKKGYRDMLWFMASLFLGLLHPIMVGIPLALILLFKDLADLQAVIDHKRMENEMQALEEGSVSEHIPQPAEIELLKKKLQNTRRAVNGTAFVLMLGGLVVLLAGGLT